MFPLINGSLFLGVEDGQVVAEEVRTELRFLYDVDSEEAQGAITTNHHQYHIGLGETFPPPLPLTSSLSPSPSAPYRPVKSHLNCAVLSHEYALKYNSFSRDLTDIKPLCQVRYSVLSFLLEVVSVNDPLYATQTP